MHPLITLLILRGYGLYVNGSPEHQRYRIKQGKVAGEYYLAWNSFTSGWELGRSTQPEYYSQIEWSELMSVHLDALSDFAVDMLQKGE